MTTKVRHRDPDPKWFRKVSLIGTSLGLEGGAGEYYWH